MNSAHIPVWFDIDGTLVHTSVGKDAFRIALHEVYGWEDDFTQVRFAGNTDLCVLMDFSEKYSGKRDTVLEKAVEFFECMAIKLDEGLAREKPESIPGANELLDHLTAQDPLGLYLLTGNAKACAFHKLRHADLHTPFQEGGFGDDHADRNILAKQTRQRISETFGDATPGWVIGDTPRDVQAALSIGAKAIGVASGAYTGDELKSAGAVMVVDDLTDSEAILKLILS